MNKPLGVLLFWVLLLGGLPSISTVLAQCGCGTECNSGCDCGCNDSEKAWPPTEGGGPNDSLNVNFLSQLTLAQLGAEAGVLGNDCWGWTDPTSGREFAIMGLENATCFIEITNPQSPVFVGKIYGYNNREAACATSKSTTIALISSPTAVRMARMGSKYLI